MMMLSSTPGAAKRTLVASLFCGAALLALEGHARADEPVDTVFLSNGGRVRGTVMVETPSELTIRLNDGTVRSLKPADVAKVQYAGSNAAPPSPAPAVAPV